MKKEKINKDIKTFLGVWEILENNKIRRVVNPIRLKWFKNQIELAENCGY